MRQVMGPVTRHIRLADRMHLMNVLAPEIAHHAQPGQFVHVRCLNSWDPLLRRPLSLCKIGKPARSIPDGEIALLFEEIGRGTELLGRADVGARLDLLGPLGNGFTLHDTTRNVLLVAGGLGVAPLVGLAEEAIARDMSVVLLAGASSAYRLLPAEHLPPEVEYVLATDDGSIGHKGFVTDLLGDYIPWADQLFTCGPMVMFDTISKALRESSLPAQASMESRMGCGLGACLGCVIQTRKGRQRICREGPVFALRDIT